MTNWQGTELAKPARIPALDGIRGLAICLVLWWHVLVLPLYGFLPNHRLVSWFLSLGRFTWSGVDLFFVLSGFLIGGILLDAARSSTYFTTFYIRRAYRILPLYWAMLILTLAVYGTKGWGFAKVAAELSWFLLFLQNFRVVAKGAYAFSGLGMTWSLAVEEQFYLTLPVVIRLVRRRTLYWLLLGGAVAAPLLRIFLLFVLKPRLGWAVYVLMPCRADGLCLGALIAIAIRNPSLWGKLVRNHRYLYAALAFVEMFVGALLLSDFKPFTTQLFGLEYSLLASFYAFLLLCTLISTKLTSVFSFRPLRFMGSIAYGVYLLQELVSFALLKIFERSGRSGIECTLAARLLSVPLVIGVAALSWKYFEKPLVERGHRYRYGDRKTSLQNVGSVEKSVMQNAS